VTGRHFPIQIRPEFEMKIRFSSLKVRPVGVDWPQRDHYPTIAKETEMKTLTHALLLAGILILVTSSTGMAQDNTDTLRKEVSQAESIDINSKPAAQQAIFKSARIDLYQRFQSVLEREIADLANIKADNNADLQRTIASEMQALEKERKSIAAKIQALKEGSRTAASASTREPDSAHNAVSDPPVNPTPPGSNSPNPNEIPASDSLASAIKASSSAQASTLRKPSLDPITESDPNPKKPTILTGSKATPNAQIRVRVNRGSKAVTHVSGWDVTADSRGRFRLGLETKLEEGDEVQVQQELPAGTSSDWSDPVKVIGQEAALMLPHGPVGLMIGGNVISNQSQNFSQADPFFGFIAGYSSRRVGRGGSGGSFNLRFQGIFSSAPRTAAAPAEDAEDPNVPNVDLPFLSSRKTFDTDLHFWWEFPVLGSKFITLGPYAGIGASTVLDKNELKDEEVRVESDDTATGTDTDLDTSQVKTDNDLKKYYEYGLVLNIYLPNRGLFLQSTLAKGHYEALGGLYKDVDGFDRYDTRKRFHGRVTIFPMGLARGFGAQTRLTPMFGIDLNASRGPDSLRFYSGFALSLKGIPTQPPEAAAAPEDGENGEQ
jgi:hypothetical protein